MSWETFLKAHWGAIAATDFFSVGVLTRVGLVRYFVLFVIDLQTRRVEIAGIVQQPDEWMKQVARNLTDADSGFLNGTRYLIHDPSIHRSVQGNPQASQCEDRETSGAESQSERIRGEVCAFGQV